MSHALPDKVLLTVHVQPKASKNEVVGPYGDAIKIRLTAPPVDGAANAALVAFLAAELGVPKSAVSLVSGETSRRKIVAIEGTRDVIEERLRAMGALV